MARHDAEAFQFPEVSDPLPGLTEDVDRLWGESRYEAALDLILQFLRTEGRAATAFYWAMFLLINGHRTSPEADVEPITPPQQANPYFAPVATECARCTRFWYSSHLLLDATIAVSSPIGLQCPTCRYSLCRDCLPSRDRRCPERRCRGELGVPVLPTGRPRGMPANRFTEKLEHVLILWHDTPTSREEVDELLDLTCTWQDRSGITVRSQASPVDGWDPDVETRTALVLVGLYEQHGMISDGGLAERTRAGPIESPGRGRRLVLVTAAPATGPTSRLSGPITYRLSDEPDEPNAD